MSDAAMSRLTEEVREVVKQGLHVRAGLRKLTLASLQRGKLEAAEVRKVISSVIEGAVQGAGKSGNQTRQALEESLHGLDDALAIAAEASMLAIDEASGRLHEFGKQDIERFLSDMQTLEQLFLESVRQAADRSSGELKDMLQDLMQHVKSSGSAAGSAALSSISKLEQKLGKKLSEIIAAGNQAALGTGVRLAESAAGILGRLAATLDEKSNSMSRK